VAVPIHQLIPSLNVRDAVSNHTLRLQRLLRRLGHPSEVYAVWASTSLPAAVHPASAVPADPGSWLLYQHSIGSLAADRYARHRGGRLLNYHNVTPAELFEPWEPDVGGEIDLGRRQLAEFAACTDHAIAVSEYNRGELVELGYRSTGVAPILIDTDELRLTIDPKTAGRLRLVARRRPGSQILAVGRIAPNKGHHQLVPAFAAYRHCFDPGAHLHVVGPISSHRYADAVRHTVDAAGLRRHVTFHGNVSDGALGALYHHADALCMLSDHEGFGVPLLEAMAHDLPIVAFASAGIPGTAGDAAILLPDRRPETVATALHRVVTDERVRNRLISAGRERLEAFSLQRTEAAYAEQIGAALEAARG
jgi:glycosyltransferase involved in cell wall biosynthesis